MDSSAIDKLRNANFSHAVRGYDRHEVDEFLRELADFIEQGGDPGTESELIRAELERVGEQTASILTEAHRAAQEIRSEADAGSRKRLIDANATAESLQSKAAEDAERTRAEADAYARRTRSEADAYAQETRDAAAADAEEARSEAEREADRIVEEAAKRRRDTEAVISDLEERRDAVVGELDRLASGIQGTATQARGTPDADAERPPSSDGELAARANAAKVPTQPMAIDDAEGEKTG